MKTYVDANLLVRLYLNLPGSVEIAAKFKDSAGKRGWPFPVTDLLRFEVVNGIHRMVFECRHGGQWRVTPEIAACALGDFDDDLTSDLFLRRTPLALADIEPAVLRLSARHTESLGVRTYDLMHVGSALTLRCKRFWSGDAKASALAQLAGLETM